MESDQAYFVRRATEERAAADSATNAVAKKAHYELAARYDEMAFALGPARERALKSPQHLES